MGRKKEKYKYILYILMTPKRGDSDSQIHKVHRQILELASPNKCGSLQPKEN